MYHPLVGFELSSQTSQTYPVSRVRLPCRTSLFVQVGEQLRGSREEVRRCSAKLSELEADRVALERQAENDADVTAERIRVAGHRITELQGEGRKIVRVRMPSGSASLYDVPNVYPIY